MNNQWQQLIDQLRGAEYQFGVIRSGAPVHHVEFDVGLSDDEIMRTEQQFGFRFPPDLRGFLQTALPCSSRFPDWRSGDKAELRDWLDEPGQGILFDIENNGFWLEEWGLRPDSLEEALRVGNRLISAAPRLIPIFGHRMIPDEPHLPGNPVFSVHQTDIIYFGADLADYLRNEFKLPAGKFQPDRVRQIRFWDIERFQVTRLTNSPNTFDNRKGQLPT